MSSITALISVHDVMPETFSEVEYCLQQLNHIAPEKITLLVVPGKLWSEAQIHQLHVWQQQGFQLAAHGWEHRCKTPANLHHKLHSLLISRNVAEHLSCSEQELKQLLARSHDWFVDNDFQSPIIYVPPAWAMGRFSKSALIDSPFRIYENLHSVIDLKNNQQYTLPLLGFEADNVLRAVFLRGFNRINWWLAKYQKRPLRIGIHPFDFNYHIANQLSQFLHADIHAIAYDEIDQALAT